MIPESVLKEIKEKVKNNTQHISRDNVPDYLRSMVYPRDVVRLLTDMYERMEKQIESKDEEIKRLREALENSYDEEGMKRAWEQSNSGEDFSRWIENYGKA